MIRSVRRKSRARRASPASIGLAPPTFAASICRRAMRSMKTARNAASCDGAAGGEQAVVGEQQRVLVPRPRRSTRLRGRRRQAGPVGRNAMSSNSGVASIWATTSGLLGGGERRGGRRMGVDDRLQVGSRAVDPEMEAGRRIRSRMPYEPLPSSTFRSSSMSSHDASSASSKARPSGRSRSCLGGARAVSWPASPDSWPSSARIQAQRVSAPRGSLRARARVRAA